MSTYALVRDLAGHDAQTGREQRLAGDARHGVLREDGVEDRVRDLVGDLVGVSFGHRLRGEEGAVAHGAPCDSNEATLAKIAIAMASFDRSETVLGDPVAAEQRRLRWSRARNPRPGPTRRSRPTGPRPCGAASQARSPRRSSSRPRRPTTNWPRGEPRPGRGRCRRRFELRASALRRPSSISPSPAATREVGHGGGHDRAVVVGEAFEHGVTHLRRALDADDVDGARPRRARARGSTVVTRVTVGAQAARHFG